MSAINLSPDTDPTLSALVDSTTRFVSQNYLWLQKHYTFPNDTLKDLEECRQRVPLNDALIVLLLAIVWTIARFSATKYILTPFARVCGMSKSETKKYPECAWKFFYYLFTFSITLYLIFGQNCCNYFSQRSLIWKDYSINDSIPANVRTLYLIEISFYIHSIYAVIFLDEWRKDSLVMFSHHIITLALLTLSLATKAHRVGVLVLLLHDGCDVAMEATKCLLAFKSIGGLFGKFMDVLSGVGFILFLSSWFVCRLYWFPLKAIYSSSEYFTQRTTKFPFMVVLYSLLWLILAMDVYWFSFIVKILVNIITGKSRVEDNREYSEGQSDKAINQRAVNGVHKRGKQKQH